MQLVPRVACKCCGSPSILRTATLLASCFWTTSERHDTQRESAGWCWYAPRACIRPR